MKKTLLKLLTLVTALAVAAFLVNREEPAPAPKTLEIAGYASPQELEAEKGRGILDGPADIAYPIDEIVITKGEQTTHLVRSGSGKDLLWNLTAPMEAPAVKFRVEKMLKLFKEKTESVHTKRVRPADHGLFDLEAERRIRVTLKSAGAVWEGADLVIGRVEESESQASQDGITKDTWVLIAGDEETAYRLAGKDLRTEFMTPLSELRDKKLFTVQPNDIVHITVTTPDGSTVALDGQRTEVPAKETDKPATATVAWAITNPSGFKADDSVRTFARHISNARAKTFIAAAEGPKGGLGDEAWHISARTHEGKTLGLRIADGGDPTWGQVDGTTEWVQLDPHVVKNLQQSLPDLRDKTLWSVPKEQITAVSFGPKDGEQVTVTRQANGWVMNQGGPADMDSHLGSLATLKAKRFAKSTELSAARASLGAPSFKAQLTTSARTYQLVVGPALTEGALKNNRWAAVDSGPPVLLAGFTAKHFQKTRSDVQQKRFFMLTRDTIQALSVTHPDGSKVALARARPGGPLELTNPPDGKATKQAAVGTMVGTLPNLKAKTFETATTLKAAGLVPETSYRVVVRDTAGAEHVLLVSTQTAGPDPYAVALTGPLAKQVATISNFQALNLKKTTSELSE
ncbi:MAG: DUF4340 domain-containing protein [Myxococcota bacterium]